MPKKGLIAKSILAITMLSQNIAGAQSQTRVERPPQYVLLAFDGSYANGVWQFSRDFSQQQKNKGIDTRFTYFINPVYFVDENNKQVYSPPGYRLETRNGETVKVRNRGSAIGWGDDRQDIATRIEHMNDAYLEGHEIGSHAVGHFDAGYKTCNIDRITRKCERDDNNNIVWKWDLRWSESEWKSEFDQFYSMLDNVFSLNNIRPKHEKGLLFRDQIKGFRAPVLGVSDGLWPNLPRYGIQYDTSKMNFENYWPAKNSFGTWDFPLAEILEPGGARRWVSMDYNFCVRDSARVISEDPSVMNLKKPDGTKANKARDCLNMVSDSQKAKIKKNMMDLYTTYFNRNYYGNRAPVHIGHHFSQWMSGAYYETFFEFATQVCNKPEVKCVTYAELMKFMNSKTSSEIAEYKKGNFEKLVRPKSTLAARHLDIQIDIKADSSVVRFGLSGADAKLPGTKMIIDVAGIRKEASEVSLKDIRDLTNRGEDADIRVSLENRRQNEIATATFKVQAVGTANEFVNRENQEGEWLRGHLQGAHNDELDFTKGH